MEIVTYFVVVHKTTTCLVEKEPAEKLERAVCCSCLGAQVAELLGLGAGMGWLGTQLQPAAAGCHLNSLLEVLRGAGGTPSYQNHHGEQVLHVSGV